MRIALLMALLTLSACSTAQPVAQMPHAKPNLHTAEAACLRKGYPQNSFEFAECYDNRPEVQEYTRDQRFSNMAIINTNRSGGTVVKSYPVE